MLVANLVHRFLVQRDTIPVPGFEPLTLEKDCVELHRYMVAIVGVGAVRIPASFRKALVDAFKNAFSFPAQAEGIPRDLPKTITPTDGPLGKVRHLGGYPK